MSRISISGKALSIGMGIVLSAGLAANAQTRQARAFKLERASTTSGSKYHFHSSGADSGKDQDPSVHLGGARFLFEETGGLAGVDNELRVFDDGSVLYQASRLAVGAEAW